MLKCIFFFWLDFWQNVRTLPYGLSFIWPDPAFIYTYTHRHLRKSNKWTSFFYTVQHFMGFPAACEWCQKSHIKYCMCWPVSLANNVCPYMYAKGECVYLCLLLVGCLITTDRGIRPSPIEPNPIICSICPIRALL